PTHCAAHTAAPTMERPTLSLRDALPIFGPTPCKLQTCTEKSIYWMYFVSACARTVGQSQRVTVSYLQHVQSPSGRQLRIAAVFIDRKSTRLNSSHVKNSYAVFGLKKKSA